MKIYMGRTCLCILELKRTFENKSPPYFDSGGPIFRKIRYTCVCHSGVSRRGAQGAQAPPPPRLRNAINYMQGLFQGGPGGAFAPLGIGFPSF